MNVLLTGATGFVGMRFIDLLADTHNIVCIGRTKPVNQKITFINADLTDRRSLEEVAERFGPSYFDVIVNLAAYVPRTKDADTLSAANAVNVEGLINLVEAFEGKFKKLIQGSSAEVYDLSSVQGLLTEQSPTEPSSYYGVTKLNSEYIARTYGKKNDIPVAVLRFSVMYGANDPIERALPIFIRNAISDKPIDVYGGSVLRDYIHVDDVVAGIECAMEGSFLSGLFNIGTGSGVAIRSAAEYVVKLSKSKSRVIDHEGTGSDVVLDISHAQDVIGFQPKIFFPDKLDDMIQSYR